MKASPAKLTSEERRAAIIAAARRVFAERGFDGTTTRELAEAAGVSEALLFKHFPNKEALYSAMLLSCCQSHDPAIERLKSLEPSTLTLVIMVHFLLSRKIGSNHLCEEDDRIQMRLMMRSLMEDGEFARLQLQRLASGWVPKIEECLKIAVATGDAVVKPIMPNLAAWFTHHLAVLIMQHLRCASSVVDYNVSRSRLAEQAVWFTLRGMGLKEEAITRYYNPQALGLFAV